MKKAPMLTLILLTSLLCSQGCTRAPQYPVSDHYDGKRFHNPGNAGTHSAWEIAKLLATIDFEKWPERVENSRPDSAQVHSDAGTPVDSGSGRIAVTFIGHATMLIETSGLTVLTDPVWSEQVGPTSWLGPTRVRDAGLALESLPRVDIVLISHNHYDHLDLNTLKRLDTLYAPNFLVPLGDKKLLASAGISNAHEMDWWQSFVPTPGVTVTFTPVQHGSARGLFDRNKSLWGGYMIDVEGVKIYFGGDAAYSADFTTTRERLGSPDLALLPIGAYSPRWFMKSVHMNPEDAVRAHLDLGAKRSVGMHHGTFQQTEEAIDAPARELYEALLESGVDTSAFTTISEGIRHVVTVSSHDAPPN